MSKKRVKQTDGWYVPVPGRVAQPPRPSTGSLASDAVVGVLDTWYYQEAQAAQALAAERANALDACNRHLAILTENNIRLTRSNTRRGTLLNIANERVASLQRETEFKTALIAEIFARFPEVGHEYEWAFNREVLNDFFEEDTEEEELLD